MSGSNETTEFIFPNTPYGIFGVVPTPGQIDAFGQEIENRGPEADIITWVFWGVVTLFLGLRVYCKWVKSRGLWWDDYLLIIVWSFILVNAVLLHQAVEKGFGMHFSVLVTVVPMNLQPISLGNNISGTFSILGAAWSKTSFALTLLRIAEDRWFKVVVWFILITINIVMSLTAILAFFQCNPTAKVFDDLVAGTCWRDIYSSYSIFASVYSGVMDVALAMLPWKIVWGLQMKASEKFGVALAMSMGVIAGATGFVKAAQIPALAKGDFTYDGYGLVVWGTCEVSMTVIAACVPVLRVLVRDVKASATRYRNYGSAGSTGGVASRVGGTSHHGASKLRDEDDRSNGADSFSRNNTTVVANATARNNYSRPNNAKGGADVHGDDWSERSILKGDEQQGRNRGIIHTHEVKVEYSDGSGGSGGNRSRDRSQEGYEMGPVVR